VSIYRALGFKSAMVGDGVIACSKRHDEWRGND